MSVSRGYGWGQESGEVSGPAFNSLCDLEWVAPLLSLCKLQQIALPLPSPPGLSRAVRLTHVKHIRFIAWKLPGKHEILGLVYLPYSFKKESKISQLLERIWTTFPPLRGLQALLCSIGNGKPQLCACVCLEKSVPNPKMVKDRFEKKKVRSQELPFRFLREWSDFPKNSLPRRYFLLNRCWALLKPCPFQKSAVFERVQIVPTVHLGLWHCMKAVAKSGLWSWTSHGATCNKSHPRGTDLLQCLGQVSLATHTGDASWMQFPSASEKNFRSFKIFSELCPLHNFFGLFFYFSFSQAIFRIILGENHPLSRRLSMKTVVYLLNSCKDKGSLSLSAGLISSPFFQLLPDVQVAKISLLCLKFTTALFFASPNSLLQDLPAWQQRFAQGQEAKLAPAARTWLSVLCPVLGLMLWRVIGEGSRVGFSQVFFIAGSHEHVRES